MGKARIATLKKNMILTQERLCLCATIVDDGEYDEDEDGEYDEDGDEGGNEDDIYDNGNSGEGTPKLPPGAMGNTQQPLLQMFFVDHHAF